MIDNLQLNFVVEAGVLGTAALVAYTARRAAAPARRPRRRAASDPSDQDDEEQDQDERFRRNVTVVSLLALAVFALVGYFFSQAPVPTSHKCDGVSVGSMINGVLPEFVGGQNDKLGTVRRVWACAEDYRADHPNYTLAAFVAVYVTLQTFAIPGPIVLSILAGALYPFVAAQVLVAACATTGASLCFMLSYVFGRGVVDRALPGMIRDFRKRMDAWRDNLFFYMLFLRVTPLLPNWSVNLASPIVGVPYSYFGLATLIGLVPANFLHVSTGATLHSVAGVSASDGYRSIAILFALQFVALLPTMFKKRLAAVGGSDEKKES